MKRICGFTVQRKLFFKFWNGEGWSLCQWLHPVDQNPLSCKEWASSSEPSSVGVSLCVWGFGGVEHVQSRAAVADTGLPIHLISFLTSNNL